MEQLRQEFDDLKLTLESKHYADIEMYKADIEKLTKQAAEQNANTDKLTTQVFEQKADLAIYQDSMEMHQASMEMYPVSIEKYDGRTSRMWDSVTVSEQTIQHMWHRSVKIVN